MRVVVGAALLLATVGCVTARATMLVPTGGLVPVPADQVRIYLEPADVPASCREIALIETEGDASSTNRAEMIEAARRKAGSVGANALVLGEMEEPSTGRQVANAILGIRADRRSQMVAFLCEETEEK